MLLLNNLIVFLIEFAEKKMFGFMLIENIYFFFMKKYLKKKKSEWEIHLIINGLILQVTWKFIF